MSKTATHAAPVASDATSKQLAIGIVGPGRIAEVQAEAIGALGHVLVGVVGSTPERGAEAATRFNTRSYDTLEELLDRVDVLHVASPHSQHPGHALTALRHQRPVICEKPLALSPAVTRRMVDAAQQAGSVHATHLQRRFYREIMEIRRLIATGAIGEPWSVRVSFLQDWTALPADHNWRMKPTEGGAQRVVYDLMPHCADLVEFVTRHEIDTVQAQLGASVTRERSFAAANDHVSILITTQQGVQGTILASQISHGRSELRLEVDGAEASIDWSHGQPEKIVIRRRGSEPEVRCGVPDPVTEVFARFYAEVYRAVADGRQPKAPSFPTFLDGDRQARIAAAIIDSALSGARTSVAPMGPARGTD